MAWAGASAAQPMSGTVTGRVTAEGGVDLADVTITATHLATGVRHVTQTLADGRYRIAGLPLGEYDIAADRQGFTPAVRVHQGLVSNDTVVVDFVLTVTAEQSVQVSAADPVREGGRSTIQQTVGEGLTHELPLLGRGFIQLTTLAAGFTGNPNYPNPQGQIYWSNNVLVDGVSHFSKWRSAARAFYSGYGLESIKEVRVLANQFPAEYGEALATVTSAVTRSGTNTWERRALLFVQNGAWDGVPPLASSRPPADAQQFGLTLGGPLVVNRAHLFTTYEGRRSRRRNVVVSPAAPGSFVPDNEDEHLMFAKVDGQLTDRQGLSARYNGQRFRWRNETGGLSLPGTGTHYSDDVQTVAAIDRWQISTRLLSEWRGQFARYVDVRRDLDPRVHLARAGYSLEGGTLGPLGFGANPEDTWEAAETLAYWSGSHLLKFGGGVKHVRARNVFLNYGWGAYFFGGAPDQHPEPFLFAQGVAASGAAATANPRSLSTFGFLQDEWRPAPALTINTGLRYDIEQVTNINGYDVAADRNNLQPRVSLAWAPAAIGGVVMRGGVGTYTQQHLLYYINRVQLEGPTGTAMVFLPTDSPFAPSFPSVLPLFSPVAALPPRDVHRVDPTFRNPYSIQASAGAERRFGGSLVSADYLALDGRDLMSLVDANPPESIAKPIARSVAAADATRPLAPAVNTYRKVITLGNHGRSWYRALQIRAERSSGPLRLVGSYTLSRAEDMGNYQIPENSRNLAAEKARADSDITHNVAVGFARALPGRGRLLEDWSIAGLGVFRSGRPYTVTWGDDRNGTTQNDARPGARNTGQTDAFHAIDIALTRRFHSSGIVVEARLEAFNLLNTTNYDEYVGALSSALYGRPVSAFAPRRLQLAAVVRF